MHESETLAIKFLPNPKTVDSIHVKTHEVDGNDCNTQGS